MSDYRPIFSQLAQAPRKDDPELCLVNVRAVPTKPSTRPLVPPEQRPQAPRARHPNQTAGHPSPAARLWRPEWRERGRFQTANGPLVVEPRPPFGISERNQVGN